MVSSTTYSCLARSLSLRKKTDRIYYPDVLGGAAAGRAPLFLRLSGRLTLRVGKTAMRAIGFAEYKAREALPLP